MASFLGNEHAHCTRARSALRHTAKQKKRETFVSLLVPYDILFSNEFLRDLGRLWSLRDIVPDPNNLPWIEKDDK